MLASENFPSPNSMQYKSTKNKIKRNALFHIPLYKYRKKAKTISTKSRIVSLIKKLVNPTVGSRVSFILGSMVFLSAKLPTSSHLVQYEKFITFTHI